MTQSLKILHIEDVRSDAELVERTLTRSGIEFEKIIVDTREEYIKALDEFYPDIVLSDHSLPSFNSLEALNILKQTKRNIPFILITATVSEEFAVNVMKEGASDYILKDRLQRLPSAVIKAIEKCQSDNERLVYLDKIFASEALFTKAELLAEFGTWRIDIGTNRTTWSAGTYPLLGYENGEVVPNYENFIKNIHPEDVDEVERNFKEAVTQVHSAEVDFRIINKDKSIRFIHAQLEFQINEQGYPVHIIGFNQDVTRAKLAQIEIQNHINELKAASDRQNDILNALPPNVVLLDAVGKIVAVNESWKKSVFLNKLGVSNYGIDFKYLDVFGKTMAISASTLEEIAQGMEEVIKGARNEFATEYSCYCQNKWLWFQLLVAPLTDKTKKGAVVLHIDITERKIAEQERDRSTVDLVARNVDLEKFAYIISHNLRAPVANIIGASSALNNLKLNDTERDRLCQGINQSAVKLDEVVKDLNLILQAKGGTDAIKETIYFSELVDSIKISLKNLIDKDDIVIKYDFSAIDELISVKAYLYSIFFNLILNSVKYRRQGVRSIINVSSHKTENTIQLIFADNGIGIDLKKNGDQLFGLYKRFHHEIDGKGMGLFMVKTQVETLGGKITVQSEENRGTEFKIQFDL